MIEALAALSRPLFDALEPETAHRLALRALRFAPSSAPRAADPALAVEAFGLKFANPLGLAAGFDKDAVAADALGALGFGFVEVGTLTPLPQAGNPRPRLFRLREDRAVINRMGFNNRGHAAALERLRRRRGAGPLGVNVGANKDAADRVADYVAGVRAFAAVADWLTINVSSPNTPGLRDLQSRDALDGLLARALDARAGAQKAPPILLKIAPDVNLAELDDIVAVARARRIDGMIVSNTTISRPAGLAGAAAKEAGGLSGAPVFDLSTRILRETFLRVERQFPLIGCGGIGDADALVSKLEAGAALVQVYTAFAYGGPSFVTGLLRDLPGALARRRHASIAAASAAAG